MNRDGTAQRRIAAAPEAYSLALSADGQLLMFVAPTSDRVDSTWSVPATGGALALLIKGLTRTAPSPDGRLIAGIWQERPDANPVLAVFAIGGGRPIRLFDTSAASANGGVWWSKRQRGALLYDRQPHEPVASAAAGRRTNGGDDLRRGDDQSWRFLAGWANVSRVPRQSDAGCVFDYGIPIGCFTVDRKVRAKRLNQP